MSDDDFMQDSEEEYDFEYEDDEEEDEGAVDIENKYYNAKQLKAADPEDAIKEFLGVPPLESEKGDWGFKGLKQAIKLEFKLRRYDQASRPRSVFWPLASGRPPPRTILCWQPAFADRDPW